MKTCDCCEHGNCMGEGCLYCELYEIFKENYDFVACDDFIEEV